MNKELWQKLDKLRAGQHAAHNELASFLVTENIQYATKDLATWQQFLATRFGRAGAGSYLPAWLVDAMCALAQRAAPKSICDPWAGLGFLVAGLREACLPERALAFTQNPAEQELGRILVPRVEWHLGEAVRALEAMEERFDLLASVLPMSARAPQPMRVVLPSGETDVVSDLGDQLLVASARALATAGTALLVVTPSFFFRQNSVFPRLSDLGIGIEAAFSLPAGTFAPATNIPAYLVVARPIETPRMFVAQLSTDSNTNRLTIANFVDGREGESIDRGIFVLAHEFKGLDQLRAKVELAEAERRFGAPSVPLAELATAINLGRRGEDSTFLRLDNSIYVPLIGSSAVLDSADELTMKPQNYAQVVIDPARSDALFVANFLNSHLGRELRARANTGFIPRLNKQSVGELRVLVSPPEMQRTLLAIDSQITAEQRTTLALQNELSELRRELWATPAAAPALERRVTAFSERLSGRIRQHVSESLAQWFETLPFPLASILRAWQATPSDDFKTRYEHLLHFFEATAQLTGVVLLSAFSANDGVFRVHRQKLAETMSKQHLSFSRTTFGTWKLVVEYLGKQTRELLREQGKTPEQAQQDRALCADMFSDSSLSLPAALTQKELAAILAVTNKMRNDWSGHGGVVGQSEAESRNQRLILQVESLRGVIADAWAETQLLRALHCRPRRNQFENEVAVLMGSNTEFLKETRTMATWLDVERLYLSKRGAGQSLKLLPLVHVGPSPQSAKNACYFFSRLEREGARFVSYHFSDMPELIDVFADATDAIRLLTDG